MTLRHTISVQLLVLLEDYWEVLCSILRDELCESPSWLDTGLEHLRRDYSGQGSRGILGRTWLILVVSC